MIKVTINNHCHTCYTNHCSTCDTYHCYNCNYLAKLLQWLRRGGDADQRPQHRRYWWTYTDSGDVHVKIHNRSKEEAESIISMFKLKYPNFTMDIKVEEI